MTPALATGAPRDQEPVREPAFNQWNAPDGTVWTLFYRQPRSYLVRFPGLVDFEISTDGESIKAWPARGAQPATMEHLFLNQAVPLALSRQGKLVLHASAVDFGGRALAFIGASGRGKSTLATSFATNGARFITDDGLQLAWSDVQLTAIPSHPSVRLWEDSSLALFDKTMTAAAPIEYSSKTRFLAGPEIAFCDESQPLRRIYLLGPGSAAWPAIERAKPASTLMALVRNSFLLDIDEKGMLALHFDELSRIANLPIHYHLDYPRRYEELAQVRDVIAHHANEG